MATTDADILQESFKTPTERRAAWASMTPDRQKAFLASKPPLERASFLQGIGLSEQALYYQGLEGKQLAAAVGTDVGANALSTLAAVLPTGEEREAGRTLEELRAKERPGPGRGEVAADRGQIAAVAGAHALERRRRREGVEATQGERTSAAAQERLRRAEAREETEERVGMEGERQRAADADANREIREEARASAMVQAEQLRARQAIMSGISKAASTVGTVLATRAPLSAEAKAALLSDRDRATKAKLGLAEEKLTKLGDPAGRTLWERAQAKAAEGQIARLKMKSDRYDYKLKQTLPPAYPGDPQTSPVGLGGRQGVPPVIPPADTATLVNGTAVVPPTGKLNPWDPGWLIDKYTNNRGG